MKCRRARSYCYERPKIEKTNVYRGTFRPDFPKEIDINIVRFIATHSSAETLREAAQIFNALACTNKFLNDYVNDNQRTLGWIKQLSKRYRCSDIDVARMLCTRAANKRLALQRAFFYSDCNWHNFIISDANKMKSLGLDLDFTYEKEVPTVLLKILLVPRYSVPIYLNILKKSDEIAQWLISNCADINILTSSKFRWNDHMWIPSKQNASLLALRFFNTSVISDLLQHKAFKVNYRDGNKDTPLHCCFYGLKNHASGQNHCNQGCQQEMQRAPFICMIAEQLLEKGANPLAMNRDGKTPLALAEESGNQLLINLLQKAAVDFNSRSK